MRALAVIAVVACAVVAHGQTNLTFVWNPSTADVNGNALTYRPVYRLHGEGGTNWASLSEAEAAQAIAEQTHRQALLSAEQQVAAAQAREQELLIQLDARRKEEKSAKLAFGEILERYLSGLDSYVQVLTSLASLQAAQLNRLQTHRDIIINRIDLYYALGGEWTVELGGVS